MHAVTRCGSKRIVFSSYLSPPTLCVPGIKLRLSALVAGAFIAKVLSPAQCIAFDTVSREGMMGDI